VHTEAIAKLYIATAVMLAINQYRLRIISLVWSVLAAVCSLWVLAIGLLCLLSFSIFPTFCLSAGLLNRMQKNFLEILKNCKL